MSATARLGLPMLAPGQAQKELSHNEALQMLDFAVAAAVEEPPRASPPSAAAIGSCYIVAASPTGTWAGKAHHLAAYTSGGWRFLAPIEGLSAYIRSTSLPALFRSGGWEIGVLRGSSVLVAGQQVVGARQPSVPTPAGGATIDTEARSAIGQILTALRQHGLVQT
jgi:hypothetical protein